MYSTDMTGKELIKALRKLSSKELELECIHGHREYGDEFEDYEGFEVCNDIKKVRIISNRRGKGEKIRLGD